MKKLLLAALISFSMNATSSETMDFSFDDCLKGERKAFGYKISRSNIKESHHKDTKELTGWIYSLEAQNKYGATSIFEAVCVTSEKPADPMIIYTHITSGALYLDSMGWSKKVHAVEYGSAHHRK